MEVTPPLRRDDQSAKRELAKHCFFLFDVEMDTRELATYCVFIVQIFVSSRRRTRRWPPCVTQEFKALGSNLQKLAVQRPHLGASAKRRARNIHITYSLCAYISLSLYICIYMYTHIHMYIYIYIYISY